MNFDFLQPGSTFYRIAEWLTRLVYANILWILFSLFGLIILGIMPATAALFAISHKWLRGIENFPIFKTFWQEFKNSFIKANILGVILIILSYIVGNSSFFYYQQFQIEGGLNYQLLFYFMILIVLLYFLILLYIFPLFTNYELKYYHMFKNALLISVLSPGYTILTIASLLLLAVSFLFLPALVPFMGISSAAYITMWGTSKSFKKVENKIKKMKNLDDETEKENKKIKQGD